MIDKWLTIEQIADYLQVSREKIYKLCQKSKMPASMVKCIKCKVLDQIEGVIAKGIK